PQRHVERAADFLVKQGVARVPGDGVIAAQRYLAEDASAGVLVKQAVQDLLAYRCRCIHHPAGVKPQPHSLDQPAAVARWEVEAERALPGLLDRPGKYFPVGEGLVPLAVNPPPPIHAATE